MHERTGSWASTPGVARSMRSNKGRETGPEKAIRSLLHGAGYRYRVDLAPDAHYRRRRADIVFTRIKLAIFVDGCFWHGCPEHATMPVRNREYWEPKLMRNRQRDIETTAALVERGWSVIRIWEHVPATDAFKIIANEVDRLTFITTTATWQRQPAQAESVSDV